MKDLQVTAKVPAKDGQPEKVATVTVKASETAKEGIEMFGDDAVNSNALSNWIVTLQANIRSGLRRGEDQAAIQARLQSAKMGVAAAKASADPKAAWLAAYRAADPKTRKAMKADLIAQAEAMG